MANKKYIVAPGASFVGNGKTYTEGDEISASVFGEGEKGEKRFKSFLSGDNPKIIEGKPAAKSEEKPENKNENKTFTRQELEKIALEFMQPESIAKLDDVKLKEVLEKNGKLK